MAIFRHNQTKITNKLVLLLKIIIISIYLDKNLIFMHAILKFMNKKIIFFLIFYCCHGAMA